MINDVGQERIATTSAGVTHGVVRRRGVVLEAAGQRLTFERRVPIAVLVETDGGILRREIPVRRANPLPALLPVVGYLVVRGLLKRRHRR
jgi:hypothetical protein